MKVSLRQLEDSHYRWSSFRGACQLEARYTETRRAVYLVLDNGPCHVSKVSRAALAVRAAWLHGIWLSRYSPHLNPKEREWKRLKRTVRGHLARDLRTLVDELVAGLRGLSGARHGH